MVRLTWDPAEKVDKFWIIKKSLGVFVLFYFPSIIFCTIFIGCFSLVIIQRRETERQSFQ